MIDHFVQQELLHDFRRSFRNEQITDDLYDTDLATDTEVFVRSRRPPSAMMSPHYGILARHVC